MSKVRTNLKWPRNRSFGVGIDVPDTDVKIVGMGMDRNGNSVVRLRPKYGNKRGFSIQTNGNLPMLHNNRNVSKEMIAQNKRQFGKEIYNHIDRFGTPYQTKMALNRDSGGRARAWRDRNNPNYQRPNESREEFINRLVNSVERYRVR